MEKQFTATVYIFHAQKVLLHPHEKLKKWMPPGGHLEINETPSEAARREVLEETGLEIDFIEQENVLVKAYNAVSIERPFMCLLENVPAHERAPAHQHIDFIYLAEPREITENLGKFHWFSYEELQDLDMFPDTAEVLRLLLKEKKLENLLYQRRCCLSVLG